MRKLFQDLSFRVRVLLSGIFIISSANVLYYCTHISENLQTQERVVAKQEIVFELMQFLGRVHDLEVKQRNFLIQPNGENATELKEAIADARIHIRNLFSTIRQPRSRETLREVSDNFEKKVGTLDNVNRILITEGPDEARNYFFSADIQNELRVVKQTIAEMVEDEKWMVIEEEKRLAEQSQILRNTMIGFTFLGIVILVLAMVILRRENLKHLEASDRLHDLESRYRSMVDNAPLIFWAVDKDTKFTIFEGKGLDLIGYHEDEMLGKPYSDFFGPLQGNHPLRRAQEGECVKQDIKLKERWFETIFVPVEKEVTRNQVIGISLDITERKLSEQDAKKGNEAKSRFLANMSHEIRTPIGIISGFADLALNQQLGKEERMNLLIKVKKNAEILAELVNDILDLSKVEAGKLEVDTRELDLHNFLGELNETFSFKANEKGLSFMIQIASELPRKILSDSTRLRQILMNLLGNSLKFTERGFVKLSVEMSEISQSLVELRFFVQDSGIGMSADQAERLFKPFSQADSSTSRKFGGTGLGLALSKKLAQSLNGDMRLISTEPDRGSVFVFNTIVSVAGIERFNHLDLTPKAVEEAPTNEPRLKGLKVLLVEDSPDNQYLVNKILKAEGAEVSTASDGNAGVEAALKDDFQVVLMDIQMPIMDGFEATALLREKGFDRKIIALTANALKEERDRALSQGFDDYLTKPIQKRNLIETLHESLPGPS